MAIWHVLVNYVMKQDCVNIYVGLNAQLNVIALIFVMFFANVGNPETLNRSQRTTSTCKVVWIIQQTRPSPSAFQPRRCI